MSILKHCSFQIISAQFASTDSNAPLVKNAHRADFQYTPEPGYLYVRSRAISSRINENFDGFSAEEITKGWRTFIGKPVFVSHHNENHRRARGVIVDAAIHHDHLANGEPDTWVEVLMQVDAVKFPKLAQGIIAGEIARTSMGCFVPGTPITLADGTKKPIEEIVLGDEVLTHTGQIEPVTYVMEREYRGTTYEVHSYGQSAPMVLTEEHPVWVERNGTPQWVEAAQLSTDDWVLTPALRDIGKPGEASFARLLGLYLAEGNFGYDRKRHGDTPTFVEWNYHVEEREFIEETVSLLQELGYSPVGPYIKNNCATVRVNSADLAERFLHHGGMHSWAKKVSTEVMNWEPEVQKLVVTGWLDGDGCYRKNRVEVGTASEDLAYQMYALGLRTGIPFTPPTKQHSPSAQKLGKRSKWVLQAVLFPSLRGDDFSSWGRRMSEEGQWRKITHIESRAFTGTVYNFDVDGDDSYVASDCAVHNCDVTYSMCTFCGKKAYTEAEYCKHIPRLKGKRIRRVDAKTGASSMVLVAEQCFGLNFFENSLLVEEPADPTAFVLGVDGIGVTASKIAGAARVCPDCFEWVGSPEQAMRHLNDEHGDDLPEDEQTAQYNYINYFKDADWYEYHKRASKTAGIGEWTQQDYSLEDLVDGLNAEDPEHRLDRIHMNGWNQVGQGPGYINFTQDGKNIWIDTDYYGVNAGHYTPKTYSDGKWASLGFPEGFILTAVDNELHELKMPPPPYRVKCQNCGDTSVTNRSHPKCETCGDLHVSPVRRASKTAGNNSDLELAERKVQSIVDQLEPYTEYGPEYDRSIASHLDEAKFWLGRGNLEGALRHAYLALTVAGSMGWEEFKAWDLGPTQLSFGGKRIASLVKRAADRCKYCGVSVEVRPDGKWEATEGGPGYEGKTICRESPDSVLYHALSTKTAINETIAPPEVDTLRASECPICGSDAYNGEECPVCMFIKPPDMFMDPDLGAAQDANLRQDADEAAVAGDAAIVDVAAPNLECNTCGATVPDAEPDVPAAGAPAVPGADPATPVPPTSTPQAPGAAAGDAPPPPANDESAPLPLGPADDKTKPPAGKELPKPKDDVPADDPTKTEADVKPDADPKDAPGSAPKDDSKPDSKPEDKGNPFGKDDGAPKDDTPPKPGEGHDADPDKTQEVDDLTKGLKAGDPCPVCDGQGTLEKKDIQPKDTDDPKDKDDSDPSKPEDEKDKGDGPPWEKDDKSKEGVKSSYFSRHQGVSNMAQPTVKVLAAQQATIRRQAAEIAQLKRSVNYIAALAGITTTADAANPANPIPQPAGTAAPYTTEQARIPGVGQVDVTQIGGVAPDVAADATDTVDSVGGIKADTPYQINQKVTDPVAGTEGRLPLDQVRTLPEIQFGNPLAPDQAFPLEGDFAQRPTLSSKGRTYASLRLARLRRDAGIDNSGLDDLVAANAIETNAALSNEAINHEIETLSAVVAARTTPQRPRQAARRLVPQSANGVERTIPSVAVDQPLSSFTAASASDDDAFAFCD